MIKTGCFNINWLIKDFFFLKKEKWLTNDKLVLSDYCWSIFYCFSIISLEKLLLASELNIKLQEKFYQNFVNEKNLSRNFEYIL